MKEDRIQIWIDVDLFFLLDSSMDPFKSLKIWIQIDLNLYYEMKSCDLIVDLFFSLDLSIDPELKNLVDFHKYQIIISHQTIEKEFH